ncbi:hypothetical protein CD187_22995 [Citrobacter youngae]|nr:hypothetical protein CD187_22995 [Citrobacter youngae]
MALFLFLRFRTEIYIDVLNNLFYSINKTVFYFFDKILQLVICVIFIFCLLPLLPAPGKIPKVSAFFLKYTFVEI